MIQRQILKIKETIPSNIRSFLLRAAILFLGWTLLYHLWLKPAGIPDHQLTLVVSHGTVRLLSLFFSDVYLFDSGVFLEGIRAVNIAPQCNGLELIVLYIGFLLCMPGSWKKRLAFSLAGTAAIIVLNIIRCALLAWLYIGHGELAEFAHHFAFKLIIYAIVFYGWLVYTRQPKAAHGR